MLREIRSVRQEKPELVRRWFQSDWFDLFTWQDTSGAFVKFQLCYDVPRNERAFVWSGDHGFFHDGVDSDRGSMGHAAAAVLETAGKLDAGTVVPRFERESANIAPEVRDFVGAKIRQYLLERHEGRHGRSRVRREQWMGRSVDPAG